MAEGGIESEDYLKYIAEDSGNVAADGNFSVQVCLVPQIKIAICYRRHQGAKHCICLQSLPPCTKANAAITFASAAGACKSSGSLESHSAAS